MKKILPGFAVLFWLSSFGALAEALATVEPLGPASRRTGLVISEIHYGTLFCDNRNDDDDDGPGSWPEFIEIYNSNPFFEDLSGLRLAGNISYRFPAGTRIEAGSFLVLRPGQYTGALYGCAGVKLLSKGGAILAEVTYTNTPPWPVADGTGHSIVLTRPSYGQNHPQAWSLSDEPGGSPGEAEPMITRADNALRINEVHIVSTESTSVELYNHSNGSLDLSGYRVGPWRFATEIPQGTIIPPRGFYWLESNFPYHLGYDGTIYLLAPDGVRVVDAVWHQPPYGVSSSDWGRYPDGADTFSGLACSSMGLPNCPPRRSELVINEIMYAPITGDPDDEYIELYNRSSAHWHADGSHIAGGVEFTIPSDTVIAPNSYLVVAKNPERMIARYPHLNSGNVVGGFLGDLNDDGERLFLLAPAGGVLDEVTYGVGGQWGNWSRGGGSSLELKDARSDGRLAHNWADSDESSKGVWTSIECISTTGEYLGGVLNDDVHLFLLGAGECLVDDVEVRPNAGAGANALTGNAGFESGMTGWAAQGSHDHSVIANEGFTGSSSLRLRAATRGDNGPNRIRSPKLNPPPALNSIVLLRARVKWIRGWPELALRLHGGGVEASGRMQIQPNGTPGLRNSRTVNNAGPAITEVSHAPVLPGANEDVRVTARVSDPDGVVALVLKFGVAPGSNYETVGMVDDGSGGDAVADDGVYTATVAGQAAGVWMGFYVEAKDTLGALNTFPQEVFPTPPYDRVFPSDARNRECIVRWGENSLPGAFGTYRLWLNSANTERWTTRRPLMNDTPLDATFVYNNSRVIYNVRPAYYSSAWHRAQRMTGPDGPQRVDYTVEFPADDQFLGVQEALWTYPGNMSGPDATDASALSEQAANLMFRELGLQNNYQRFVHVFVNGSHRSVISSRPGTFIMQDSQRPDADVVAQWSPGDRTSDLLWLEDWYEYPDNGDDFTSNNDADLTRREILRYNSALVPGSLAFHLGAYRFMWRLRDLQPGESANDYSTLFAMVNTASPAPGDPIAPIRLSAIEPVIDYEQWMRVLAVQHAAGNWDTYGYDRGRNAYLHKGEHGRAQIWGWDNNFTMGIGSHGPGMDLFTTTDPRIREMWNNATILRAYWQGFYEIVRGPLRDEYMYPNLDAKAAAFRDNGINYNPAVLNTVKNFIRDRRTYLLGRLTTLSNVAFTVNAIATNGNLVTLRGTAPIQLREIWINGAPYPVTWSMIPNNFNSATTWSAVVALHTGANDFNLQGYDSKGDPVPGALGMLTLGYDGPLTDPQGHVMISEIMYRGPQPRAEYVELQNTSPNFAFDLAGWRLDGLEFVFPGGAILAPGQLFVVAKDRFTLASAFSGSSAQFAYPGELSLTAETLSLIQGGSETVIDRVRYESTAPWPAAADGGGSALQLIDPREDNSRVSNWTDGRGWRFVSFTDVPGSGGTQLSLYAFGPCTIYVDNVYLVVGSVAQSGPNLLQNGSFEGSLSPWQAIGSHAASTASTEQALDGQRSLKLVSSGPGGPGNRVFQNLLEVSASTTHTLSFWFLPTPEAEQLEFRLTSLFRTGGNFTAPNVQPMVATPGAANPSNADLPPYDPIWLNEAEAGDGGWVELYNAGTEPVSLEGYFLADNYQNGAPQAFPAGGFLGPGEFKVFYMDLPAVPGPLALTRTVNSVSQIVDYFNYFSPPYGALPDGQPFERGPLRYPTPERSNLSPRIDGITRIGRDDFHLRFQVIPGRRYNLEYKDDLSQSEWTVLYTHVATEPIWGHLDQPRGPRQRFYRLSLIP